MKQIVFNCFFLKPPQKIRSKQEKGEARETQAQDFVKKMVAAYSWITDQLRADE